MWLCIIQDITPHVKTNLVEVDGERPGSLDRVSSQLYVLLVHPEIQPSGVPDRKIATFEKEGRSKKLLRPCMSGAVRKYASRQVVNCLRKSSTFSMSRPP